MSDGNGGRNESLLRSTDAEATDTKRHVALEKRIKNNSLLRSRIAARDNRSSHKMERRRGGPYPMPRMVALG